MKLYFFTTSYPYGIGEQWKTNELMVLREYFDRITVVPYGYADNFHNPKPLPDGVNALEPLFRTSDYPISKWNLFRVLASRHLLKFLREFLARRIFLDRRRLRSWFTTTVKVLDILSHPEMRRILDEMDRDTVFYFYWGKGLCDIMPFIDGGRIRKSVVRMHRFDLFEYVNGGYIPYRAPLLKGISTAAPVSQAGKDHLDSLYPRFAGKVVVMRCGTRGNGRRSLPSKDGILRIVSCSYLVPVKRVHLMVKTLASLDSNVEWHHVGDGHLRPELEALSRELGVDQRFFFHGMIDSRMILEFYTNRPLDLFVNLSESEGVPISIMEAFSAGLPVLATAVGGTGEIVDDHVGRSLRPDVTPSELAVEIRSLASMGEEEKQNMRDRAYARYLDRCDADRLARELSEFLVS